MTTGTIVSLPPLVEQPPGQSSANPAGLPGVTYAAAIPTLPQIWSGLQTFNPGSIRFAGATSGNTFLNASAVASGILTLPAASDTLVGRNTTDTLTNKTLTSPVITAPTGLVKGDVGLGNVANVDTTNAANISSGILPAARLPNPTAATLGGIQSLAVVASKWINTISTSGVPSATQPAFSDISGSVAASQMPALTGDITTVAGTVATAIGANKVTNAMLAQAAAFTLKGNATGALANETDISIPALTQKASPVAADMLMIVDSAASNALKFATVSSVASAGSVASIAGNTGAFTLSNGITNLVNDIRLDIGNLPGVTTNSNAAAGKVGEYVTATVLIGVKVALISGSPADVTSISLTAGDWDVEGMVWISGNASTTQSQQGAWISTVSATFPTAPNSGAITQFFMAVPASGQVGIPAGRMRLSLASTTTVFLSGFASFAVSTAGAYGFIQARRIR